MQRSDPQSRVPQRQRDSCAVIPLWTDEIRSVREDGPGLPGLWNWHHCTSWRLVLWKAGMYCGKSEIGDGDLGWFPMSWRCDVIHWNSTYMFTRYVPRITCVLCNVCFCAWLNLVCINGTLEYYQCLLNKTPLHSHSVYLMSQLLSVSTKAAILLIWNGTWTSWRRGYSVKPRDWRH